VYSPSQKPVESSYARFTRSTVATAACGASLTALFRVFLFIVRDLAAPRKAVRTGAQKKRDLIRLKVLLLKSQEKSGCRGNHVRLLQDSNRCLRSKKLVSMTVKLQRDFMRNYANKERRSSQWVSSICRYYREVSGRANEP
jgi:hypothetical protein